MDTSLRRASILRARKRGGFLEGIITWLNTPSGVQALDLRGVANRDGTVSLDFSSAGLKPGSYQLVLYGARSQLTGVATFTVR